MLSMKLGKVHYNKSHIVTISTYTSCHVRKRIFWYVRRTKTEISMCIRAAWLESSMSAWRNCILGYRNYAQCRFGLDGTNAQADLNLHWANMFKGTFSNITAHINIMSQGTTKPTMRPVWPAKTHISLHSHPVQKGFSFVPLWIARGAVEGTCDQRRIWSDCADDLRLRVSHKSIVGFVMRCLIITCKDHKKPHIRRKWSHCQFCNRYYV